MTNGPARRGPYAKTAARRREILAAAKALLARRGYRNTSINAIAEELGLTQAGLLYHFPSKEDLLFAVLAKHEDERRNRYRQERVEESDARCALEPLIASFRENIDDPEWVGIWTILSAEATDEDHPAHAAMVARYERIRSEMIDGLDQLCAAGVIAADVDPVHASATILAVMDGLQLQWLLNPALDILSMFEEFVLSYYRVSLGR